MTRHESDEQNGQRKLIERQGRLADTLLAASEGEALALAPAGLHALPALPGGLAQALRLYRVQAGIRAERVLAGVYPRLRERMEAHQAGSFASLAWTCWRRHPPVQGDLGTWGEALIGLLAEAEAVGLPPLWTALARLEWNLHQVERLPEPGRDPGSLVLLGRLPAAAVRLVLADHVALHRCHAPSLRGLLELPTESFGIGAREAVVVWRDGWQGRAMAIDAAALRWFEALLAGHDLECALQLAGAAFDFSAWLPMAMTRGWMARVETVEQGGGADAYGVAFPLRFTRGVGR